MISIKKMFFYRVFQNICYLFCGVVSRAAPGGLSCVTMFPILSAGFKFWQVKGLHVLAPGGLSCATMSQILRAGSKCWHVKGLHVEIKHDLRSVSDMQKG